MWWKDVCNIAFSLNFIIGIKTEKLIVREYGKFQAYLFFLLNHGAKLFGWLLDHKTWRIGHYAKSPVEIVLCAIFDMKQNEFMT